MSKIDFTAQKYIDDVLNGNIIVGKWARLAVERHVRDLETGAERGLYFDETAAKMVIAFFALLKHSKGEWAGRPVILEPWQQFGLWVLFGWKRKDTGLRRFRTSYREVARKNGKTTEAAGVGLYMFIADGEAGAEVYSAATKRDQARLSHSEAARMVKASPQLRTKITSFKDNLHVSGTASKFEPLGSDADTMDGLNVHCAIIDEVHAHKNRETYDKLDTATGSRTQPMLYNITTAGFDRQSLCWSLHEYTEKVLSGVVEDDSFFGVIYTLDEGDDWQDESVWIKANPNLGVSKKLDDMRRKAKRAAEMPSALNNFLRLELNVWTQSETKWMNMDAWRLCNAPVSYDGLRGRRCYAGLDLSSSNDITALVVVFPPEGENDAYQVLPFFWIPDENIRERVRRDRVPYDAWVRAGYVEATPGNVIDYDYVLSVIEQVTQDFDLRELAFDRWGAAQVQTRLLDMLGEKRVVQFGQGFQSMNPPMKDLERLVMGQRLAHGGNPVLTWMADNLVAREDPAGNIKPDKEKSREKIDGQVALIMALDRALRAGGNMRSVYEQRGLLMV